MFYVKVSKVEEIVLYRHAHYGADGKKMLKSCPRADSISDILWGV